jgi:hypothetical protein
MGMANCTATNAAGHQCAWPEGHKKYGFVGISGPTKNTAVPVHGYWNPSGYWEVWPVVAAPATPATAPTTKGT